MSWLWMLAGAALVLAAYLFLSAPSLRARKTPLARLYAHRGLHGCGAAENGLEAFGRAVEAGVGIELDVRFTADKKLVVFHDDTLRRVCGREERVDELTFARLQTIPLPDGGRIPAFEEVLRLVDARVPLLVEIKTCPRVAELSAAALAALRSYAGQYAVESFHPLALRYFRRHAPEVWRGQLVTIPEEYLQNTRASGAIALSGLLANALSRPDFIAYDERMQGRLALRVQTRLYRTRCAMWTVRDRRSLAAAIVRGHSAIFEAEASEAPIAVADAIALAADKNPSAAGKAEAAP